MSMLNSLNKLEIPNVEEVLKSISKTKSKMNSLNINKCNVHILYSDGRFKQTIEGTLLHIAEIPIVLIDAPSKLGFLILEDTLIYDVTNQIFEILVSEDFSHSISLNILNENNGIDENLAKLINDNEFIIPISIKQLRKHTIKIKYEDIGEIKLLPSFISSLGRAKLLENTTEKNNDGLIITLFIGLLMGIIVGGLGTTMFIL